MRSVGASMTSGDSMRICSDFETRMRSYELRTSSSKVNSPNRLIMLTFPALAKCTRLLDPGHHGQALDVKALRRNLACLCRRRKCAGLCGKRVVAQGAPHRRLPSHRFLRASTLLLTRALGSFSATRALFHPASSADSRSSPPRMCESYCPKRSQRRKPTGKSVVSGALSLRATAGRRRCFVMER